MTQNITVVIVIFKFKLCLTSLVITSQIPSQANTMNSKSFVTGFTSISGHATN